MTAPQPPEPLDWRDHSCGGSVPVSRRFDDPFYSLEDGLSETRHVFLDGNRLRERLCDGFRVAELGFGTGLNLLAVMALWDEVGLQGRISFTSFEAFPMAPAEMAKAHDAFPELARHAGTLRAHLGAAEFETDRIAVTLIHGDARDTLPRWQGMADAWFLDGFSPAKNPELWEPALLRSVAAHTAPGGTAATYTAAGHVRRALADAGFTVHRVPGYGRKRHMSVAER